MRWQRTLLVVVLVAAGCGGTDSNDGDETSPDPTSAPTTGPPTATEPASEGGGLAECRVGDADLSDAFPDGVPEVSTSEGANGETVCTWNNGTGNLIVTVWPGDEFFSECELCTPTDLGDGGWIDGTPLFWTALVLDGGETISLTASSLGLEEQVFEDLVTTAVTGS